STLIQAELPCLALVGSAFSFLLQVEVRSVILEDKITVQSLFHLQKKTKLLFQILHLFLELSNSLFRVSNDSLTWTISFWFESCLELGKLPSWQRFSKVSEYLNNLEAYLDEGDSLDAGKGRIEKSVVEEMRWYANEGEPSIIFGRDFLVTTKSKVNFGLGEMRIDLTMLEEKGYIDVLLIELVETMDEVGSTSGEILKMGKASQNKNHHVNKLTPPSPFKIEEIPPPSSIAPQPVYHPLSHKQKEKIKEALDRKYKDLEESKPIMEVLENYMTYRKKWDEIMMGRARLDNKEFCEEDKTRIVEHGLPKKMLLDIPVDKELPLLLGRQFLRTCGAVIDMGRRTMSIDDGVIRRTYFSKQRAKAYLENFEVDEEEDWLSCFKVGHDKDGNPKYGPMAPSFFDIKDEMERALAMDAYFNPFKYIIVFKKLIDFIVTNANLRWRDLPSMERHAYSERLSWLQQKSFRTPRVADWTMFYVYSFDETLKDLMKMEYLHNDGDVFVDYSWEIAFAIEGDVYPEWCLEFFSTMYFERGVDRTKLMTEKCVSFRLCRQEHVLTLPEFVVLLGLYEPSELDHRLFAIHFSRLEVGDKLFDHNEYWKKIRKPTKTNKRTSLIREPLMRIMHRLIVGALVHRLESKERCQKNKLWMMSALEDARGINVAWVIAEYLYMSALGIKENSAICGGHYMTKITQSLGYYVDEEIEKCSEPIECEKWTTKMLAKELDLDNQTLLQSTLLPQPPRVTREQRQEPSGLNSSWGSMPNLGGTSIVPSLGYEVRGSSGAMQDEDDDDASMSEQRIHTDDDMGSEED
ncbi:hypothetical protein Tco_0717247, partial [Tanacetum coccineum]